MDAGLGELIRTKRAMVTGSGYQIVTSAPPLPPQPSVSKNIICIVEPRGTPFCFQA